MVYKKIIASPGINANKLAIPFSTIDKYIRIFLKKNIIERRGSKKSEGYYTLKSYYLQPTTFDTSIR